MPLFVPSSTERDSLQRVLRSPVALSVHGPTHAHRKRPFTRGAAYSMSARPEEHIKTLRVN